MSDTPAKRGRPALAENAMTTAERQRRYRDRKRDVEHRLAEALRVLPEIHALTDDPHDLDAASAVERLFEIRMKVAHLQGFIQPAAATKA